LQATVPRTGRTIPFKLNNRKLRAGKNSHSHHGVSAKAFADVGESFFVPVFQAIASGAGDFYFFFIR